MMEVEVQTRARSHASPFSVSWNGTQNSNANTLHPLPIQKIAKQLSTLPKDSQKQLVVLVQSGAYNPVHLSHVEMFALVRRALDEKHNVTVVGGFLAPSGDSYVKSKLGDDFIAATHRIEMCKLAVADSDWLDVCSWDALTRGYRSTPRLLSAMEDVLATHFPGRKLKCYWLLGADHALRREIWTKQDLNCDIVIVGRAGSTEPVRKSLKAFTPINPEHHIFFIESEPHDISSTMVRSSLKRSCSAEGMLHPAVHKYLLQATGRSSSEGALVPNSNSSGNSSPYSASPSSASSPHLLMVSPVDMSGSISDEPSK